MIYTKPLCESQYYRQVTEVTKYVFITGGVLSGLGKGLVTCSVGKMLEVRGFSVTAVKCDPYLNVDAGTMNPYIHGEVFVLDDGYEADMDLGTYERFLSGEFTELNNITSGQVYQEVIRRERKGGYLGRCVQIIPHVTDEIKRMICLAAEGAYQDALEELLGILTKDKDYRDGAAKDTMVRIFGIVGQRSELADAYRDRLTSLLY